ncbi:MAG: nucleotide sugar dehydrogenase, partial [Acidimicrobiales bacterium]|nr:nucleotide sugar dehydrogenase [Acidimicrobiales bacterium]
MSESSLAQRKVAIIGGCGHVGLPLGIKFALAGARTILVDIDKPAVEKVNSGTCPFVEADGDAQLREALKHGLRATHEPQEARTADVIVMVTGTPVDEHLDPKLSDLLQVFDAYEGIFAPGTLVIMRSTLFPGTMKHLYERIKSRGIDIRLAFCPERVSEGEALHEIDTLPQIVSAFEDDAFEAARELFSNIAPSIIRLSPLEAELSKLMANSWRYLEFAIANQFYVIAEENGVDFLKIYKAIRHDYPRAKGYKAPGFAAGPCLFKDTMQLASYFDHQFYLGHSAMLVNEGLASVVVRKAQATFGGSLWGQTVGLLGMTFKANSDDTRESLSFKVLKTLKFHGATTIWHDPYLPESATLPEVLEKSDLLILCTPHREYHELDVQTPIVDVWGVLHKPELEIFPGT